ncbi:MAG: glycoside hydrolase family 9 protein [Phycisphaerae bacterium]
MLHASCLYARTTVLAALLCMATGLTNKIAEAQQASTPPRATEGLFEPVVIDMEQGDPLPGDWGRPWSKAGEDRFTATRDTEVAHTGSASLGLQITGGKAMGNVQLPIAAPFAGQNVQVTAYFRFEGDKAEKLEIATLSMNGKTQYQTRLLLNQHDPAFKPGTWITMSQKFVMPEKGRILFAFHGEGKAWLDDLTIAPVVPEPPKHDTQKADLMGVTPVTDRIVAFHLREGHVIYPQVNPDGSYVSGRTAKAFIERPLEPVALAHLDSYRISSRDDPAFAEAVHPVRVGHKGKGTGFVSTTREPPFVREFLVYAELPEPMQPGRHYTFDARQLSGNAGVAEFVFDAADLRSPVIQVTQVGFTPDAPKFGYLSQWMGTFNSLEHLNGALDLAPYKDNGWFVKDLATGERVLEGQGLTLQKPKDEPDHKHYKTNWTMADVYQVDFSELQREGNYVLVVEGIGRSYPFRVATNAYRPVYQAASRGLFFQRMGIERDVPEYGKTMGRSQHPDDLPFMYGDQWNKYSNPSGGKKVPEGFDVPVTGIWGWYADAGDWDHYAIQHYSIPMTLMLLYNLKPENFQEGDVGNRYRVDPNGPWIDEAKSGLPDLLDEARWLVDFGRRARHALMDQGLGTGGVPAYVGFEGTHGGPSWDDPRTQLVANEMPGGTYGYAATSAYLAYSLNHMTRRAGGAEHAESADLIREAVESFEWAEASDRPGGSEDRTALNRAMAAAALFVATGDQKWEAMFREAWETNEGGPWANHPGPGSTWRSPSQWQLAGGLYLQAAPHLPAHDEPFHEKVARSYIDRTDRMTDSYHDRGYRFGGVDPIQNFGRGLMGQPRTLMQAVAHHLTGEQKYLDEMHAAMAYMLGGNQEGRPRLTGVGHRHENAIFHPDSWYLLSFNHPAYEDPIVPGYSAPWLAGEGFDIPAHSNASERWSRTSGVPSMGPMGLVQSHWPIGEQRVYNRWSIAASEFVISSEQIWWTFAAGYLLDPGGQPVPHERPTVRLQLAEDALRIGQEVTVRAGTSSDAFRVRYFADWRLIGESHDKRDGFAVAFEPASVGLKPGQSVRITAVVQAVDGTLSVPSEAGERVVEVTGR